MQRFLAYSLAAVLLAGTLTACGDDFTLLAPESQRNAAAFFDTPGDYEIAVNGIYDALQLEGTYGGDYWMVMEMRSDNTDQGPDVTGLSAQLAAINEFKEIPTSEIVQRVWTDSYKGVARANLVLARLGDIPLPAGKRDQYEGEALFLRSLFLYNLAMTYGNVTLILEATTSPNQRINQVPASEVFAQLKTDLQRAANVLPTSYAGRDRGRVTAGAAEALLAKVLLMQGDRAGAATVLRRLTDGRYRLLDTYADLWQGRNENSAESIFEVQFKAGGIGEGNPLTTTFSPELQVSGAYRNRPTLNMLAAFGNGADPRFDASMDTVYTTNAGATEDARWVKKYNSTPFAPGDADNNFIVLRYADVLLMLAEALGEGSEAYGLINQVRARANMPPISAATPGSFTDKLLAERRVELAFENHRWFDLRRFGRESVVAANEEAVTQVKTLFPIPQREIDTAPAVMRQNPEYL